MTPRRRIIDRCNLTILLEPGHDGLAEFLAEHEVEIVASMPCYSPENVNAQRGEGVFDASITALQLLNRLGYGTRPELPLHLVYNPNGANLPGPQAELEADYKRELAEHFGIVFNQLYTITNLPVARFASWLRHEGKYDEYLETADRRLQSRDGRRPDVPQHDQRELGGRGARLRFQSDAQAAARREWPHVRLGSRSAAARRVGRSPPANHCFGCTAGAGSSCGGALTEL